MLSEVHWVSNFFTVLISLDYTIKRRTLSGFGMSVIWSNGIHLDIETISLQELFIDIRPIPSDLAPLGIREELRAVVVYFPEENIITSTAWSL